jgi:hypothetical protein
LMQRLSSRRGGNVTCSQRVSPTVKGRYRMHSDGTWPSIPGQPREDAHAQRLYLTRTDPDHLDHQRRAAMRSDWT